ncbi:THUMP domain-containing protein 2 [Lamellibrachia satsuma]|nr:THUMP domain-containing protein 2 [Lamellibrachia satsuma]
MLYFVTAARGTEDFVIDELNCKCQPTRIRKTDGKVFFELVSSNSCNLEILLSLRSVERLFVAASYNPDFRIFSKGGVYHLEKALASINNWNLCLETWRACHPRQLRCTKDAATADMEHLSQNDDEGKLDGDKDDTSSKRRKMEEEQEECGETIEPTFRVSCKCSGSAAKFFTPQHLSKVVGHQLKKQTGWKVQLRKPLLEVMVQINNGGLTVGVPLCEQPLSHRPYIKTIGLRSTLAWILTQLAKIQHGDIVLDPMCGSGTILVEAARSSPDAIYFGSDTSNRQLTLALENVNLAKVCGKVQLFQADVTHLPHILGHKDVDRIICDVPFGINHSCVKDVKELYPTLIRALDSVLALHGRVVLLTSNDLKDFLLKQVELMNTTGTPVSSLLQETCPGSSVYGDTTTAREAQRHCLPGVVLRTEFAVRAMLSVAVKKCLITTIQSVALQLPGVVLQSLQLPVGLTQ